MSDTGTIGAAPPPPPEPDRRAPPKPTAAKSALKGSSNAFSMAFGLSTAHYLFKCFDAQGHFQFARPEDALLELWLPGILVPLNLVSTIVTNWLEKRAGEEE